MQKSDQQDQSLFNMSSTDTHQLSTAPLTTEQIKQLSTQQYNNERTHKNIQLKYNKQWNQQQVVKRQQQIESQPIVRPNINTNIPPPQQLMNPTNNNTLNTIPPALGDKLTIHTHDIHNAHYSTQHHIDELNIYGSNNIDTVPIIYHTDSTIESLKLRISIRQQQHNDVLHHEHKNKLVHAYMKQLAELQLIDDNPPVTTHDITWQQKIYGPRELLQYTHVQMNDSLNSAVHHETPLVKHRRYYASQIKQVLPGNTQGELHNNAIQRVVSYNGITLYTMNQNDTYTDPRYNHQSLTSSDAVYAHSIDAQCTRMYIVASTNLPLDTTSTEFHTYKSCQSIGTEYILCCIKCYNNSKTIELTPGLSEVNTDHWYSYELNDGTGYDYRIELINNNNSNNVNELNNDAQNTVHDELQKRLQLEYSLISPQQHILNAIKQFNDPVPSRGTLRYNIYGTIDSVTDFYACNQLYCTYELQLPNHWSIPDQHQHQVLSAITQISSTMYIDRKSTAGYNYPVQWTFDSISYLPLQQPVLYVQVNSIDYWNVHSVVGYGYIPLPRLHGRHQLHIPCLKLVPRTFTELLQQWFIGINPQLSDMKLINKKQNLPNHVYNRYGMMYENSGTVHITLDIVHTYHYSQYKKSS